jgi:hypothetical protein
MGIQIPVSSQTPVKKQLSTIFSFWMIESMNSKT